MSDNETPGPRMERILARDAIALQGAANERTEGEKRKVLEGASVRYRPRMGDYGHGSRGAPSAVLRGEVVNVHNSECADVAVDTGDRDPETGAPLPRVYTSCILAGARDTKAGDPGTFEVI